MYIAWRKNEFMNILAYERNQLIDISSFLQFPTTVVDNIARDWEISESTVEQRKELTDVSDEKETSFAVNLSRCHNCRTFYQNIRVESRRGFQYSRSSMKSIERTCRNVTGRYVIQVGWWTISRCTSTSTITRMNTAKIRLLRGCAAAADNLALFEAEQIISSSFTAWIVRTGSKPGSVKTR